MNDSDWNNTVIDTAKTNRKKRACSLAVFILLILSLIAIGAAARIWLKTACDDARQWIRP